VFNLQGGEIIIVLLLALVVLGPEKLPEAMRKAGRAYGELRKMSSGFQEEFRKAVQEPVDEVRGSVRETANMLRDSADFTKLSSGERDEKPKSAEMPSVPLVAPADPTVVPTDATPTFEHATDVPDEPANQAEPAEQAEPTERAGQAEPLGQAEPAEPAAPDVPAEPTEQAGQAEPDVPAEPVQRAEPVQPAEPAGQAEQQGDEPA
jgi:Tat protein translocase TatB subunit